MSASERRAEIIRIMEIKRVSTVFELASDLKVSERTVRRDIVVISADIPLRTVQGNGGGVKMEDWYHPHRNILSKQHSAVLEYLMDKCDDSQEKALRQILTEFGSPSCCQKYTPKEEMHNDTYDESD